MINTFEFVPDKNYANVIDAYNIWAIQEKADVAFLETSKSPYKGSILPSKGKEVIMVYDEISKILIDNGVNEIYLKLC